MNPPRSLWQRITNARNNLALEQTFTYYLAFIALGMTSASLGPTLLGLSEQTGSALSQISFLFSARSFGYMSGSFIGGRLFDRLPGHRTMALALVVIALALAAVPLVPLLWILIGLMLLIGACEALVDVGGNTLIVWVHRDGVAPYMNGLHLFFAVGALAAPLLFAQVILFTGGFGWGYWLLALLLVPVMIRLFPLPNPQPLVTGNERASVRPNVLLLALIVIFFMMVAGSELSFAGWVYTYAVRANMADEATAGYLNSAFWAAFLVGRIVSIPIATRVRPRVIIIADLILAFAGIALILLLPSSAAALWGGTVLFGLGIASTFPTMLNFASRHLTITGAVTGWFFVGASLGSMTIPLLIGQSFERIGPQIVLWIVGGGVVLALVAFIAILGVVRKQAILSNQEPIRESIL